MPLDTSRSKATTFGDYALMEKIGEGGMGTVYRARHVASDRIVALKVVSNASSGNAVLLKRFENEFRAASTLDHPNIIRALEFGTAEGRTFLAMEFVEGESLGQRLERDGKMPEAEALRVIILAAQGLHHAHKHGMIHRDVKPDNIMVTPDGQVKLADLGLVKEVDADLNLTKTGRGLGTPHFMAPEQFRNAKNVDLRGDIYSLGATLYQMVTGELPFKSLGPLDAWMKKVNNELTPPRRLCPELSERLDWAIRRAMHADPAERPASCREFIEDLTGRSSRTVRAPGAGPELWYVAYQDEKNLTHKVKGTTAAIRRSLRDKTLGELANVRAARSKEGPFEPLRHYAEFRDLVVALGPTNPGSKQTMTPLQGAAVHTQPALTTPSTSATSTPLPNRPLIKLEVSNGSGREWRTFLLVAMLAVAAGVVAAFFMLPH